MLGHFTLFKQFIKIKNKQKKQEQFFFIHMKFLPHTTQSVLPPISKIQSTVRDGF